MNTIRFKEAKCKNCYKCIRSCPVKAISFKNEQAQIMEDNCVLCGRCLQVCPQNAKKVRKELKHVQAMINSGDKVCASIAPSFITSFNMNDGRPMFSALKRLGFYHVEETAVGAAMVSREYGKLLKQKNMKNIITTACPTVVSLVEKYYPELIEDLAPVVSPMIAHARMIRREYGPDIRVVFIGPCIAKKEEYKDLQNDNAIDAVITFEELAQWFEEEGALDASDGETFVDFEDSISRFYPVPGGILKTLEKDDIDYEFISVDGIERCMEVLDSLKSGRISNYFIEMNSCTGGCINGPCAKIGQGGLLEAKTRLSDYVRNSAERADFEEKPKIDVAMNKKFIDRSNKYNIPDEEIIKGILRKIGKFTKEDELNCGACGYASCRDKAIAVYNNKAELHMCLPHMREKAESISNIIINTTPNAIVVLNRDLVIHEANAAAQRILNKNNMPLYGRSIYDILDCPDFEIVRDTGTDIINSKYHYEKIDLIVEQSVMYVRENETIIIIMKDITEEEHKLDQMHIVRCETVDIAQKVIEKQMRVAQEIASLLGETTAETKVALTKLKNTITSEMGEDR